MIGTQLGSYRVDSELGSGGMGTVYLATVVDDAPGLKRGARVAVKVVHPNLLGTPGAFKRFLREAQLGKDVRHPNVVRTLDVDAVELSPGKATHFLVMEYVEGQTLRGLLQELGRVPEELCRHIATEVAKALKGIHEASIVHRDLKPENVLITKDHQVKVMDLGVAQLAGEAMRLTQTGHFVGSLYYAAPEQFSSERDLDGRADLYSLGVLLYELATGKHPFKNGMSGRVLPGPAQGLPRSAAELNPQLSPFMEELIATLVQPERDARFRSAAKLLEALQGGERSDWWQARAREIRVETRRPLRRIRIPRETALYGRDSELRLMRGLYDKALAGDGQVLLIEGEAGIGKTRLVDEFVGKLREEGEDIGFLFGNNPPGGAATAAGAFTSAYREHFGDEGLDETLREYLRVTPTLVPAFAALLRGEAAPRGTEMLSKEALQTVFVHVTRALAAERPTIILIDDLHFAPRDGRALFTALALAAPGHRLLLVGTSRKAEAWDTELRRYEHTTRLDLDRLGPKDLSNLLVDAFGSERMARRLSFQIGAKSDGNPLFVFEIIRGLRESGLIERRPDGTWDTSGAITEIEVPSSIMDMIRGRIAVLEDADRDLLEVAACAGFEFDPLLVAGAVDEAALPVLKRLARIEQAHGLVRSSGRRYVFDHHQIQEVLYGRLNALLREHYHTALGDALERRESSAGTEPHELEGATAFEICHHLAHGGKGERAQRYLDSALEHLERRYRSDALIALADRMLDMKDLLQGRERAEILLRKAKRLGMTSQWDEERTAIGEALALVEDPALGARVHRAHGENLWHLGHYEKAYGSFQRAVELARESGDRKLVSSTVGNLGAACLSLGRFDEAGGHLEEQRRIAIEIGHVKSEATAMGNLGTLHLMQGENDQARPCYERQIELATEIGDREQQAAANANLGVVNSNTGRFDEALQHFEHSLRFAREVGDRRRATIAFTNLGICSHHVGRYADALKAGRRSHEIALETGDLHGTAISLVNMAPLQIELGRLEDAQDALDKTLTITREIHAPRPEGYALNSLGELAHVRGDEEEALRRFTQALELRRKIDYRVGIPDTLIMLGKLATLRGEEQAALQHLDEAIEVAGPQDAPDTLVLAHCHRALLRPKEAPCALALLRQHRDRIHLKDRMEGAFVLWRSTGDAELLRDAHELLEELRAGAPEDCRDSMIKYVPLHRDIAAAWEEHGEKR